MKNVKDDVDEEVEGVEEGAAGEVVEEKRLFLRTQSLIWEFRFRRRNVFDYLLNSCKDEEVVPRE